MYAATEEIGAEVGVEPARPYGQRILSPLKSASPSLTKRYKPVFIGLAVVKVSASSGQVSTRRTTILAPSSRFERGVLPP
jgi:hypothetical protein